jgi:hypothetical protein
MIDPARGGALEQIHLLARQIESGSIDSLEGAQAIIRDVIELCARGDTFVFRRDLVQVAAAARSYVVAGSPEEEALDRLARTVALTRSECEPATRPRRRG